MRDKDTKQINDLYSCIPFLGRSIVSTLCMFFHIIILIILLVVSCIDDPALIRDPSIVGLFLLILPSFIILVVYYFSHFSWYWARVHFTEEGMYWTLFQKEIRRIQWIEVTDCVAYDPNSPFRPFKMILISKRPIEHADCKRDEPKTWKKNEIHIIP